MAALSWVRMARQLTGLVRQEELANLEALIDAESERQPTYNLFILSCAIPAGIATFGFGSVFVAWLAGNTGLPLILGSALTAILAGGAWYTFHRLSQDIPPSRKLLRSRILKFSERYASFGGIFLGENPLSQEFAALLDEAAGICLRHGYGKVKPAADPPEKAIRAIEDAMSKLLEAARSGDKAAQDQALVWAKPLVAELRRVDQSIAAHALSATGIDSDDPLASLREARIELETSNTAVQELDEHLKA